MWVDVICGMLGMCVGGVSELEWDGDTLLQQPIVSQLRQVRQKQREKNRKLGGHLDHQNKSVHKNRAMFLISKSNVIIMIIIFYL